MEGATYAQKTFGEVSTALETFENTPPVVTPDAPPVNDTPPATGLDNPIVNDNITTPAVDNTHSTDTSDFSISLDDDTPASPDVNTPPAAQFNLDEELKKVDRKEVLKKLGVTDFALEIDEYLAKGGNAVDYLNAKSVDFNKISDEDIVKADLQKQYPTFTPQQINLMFNRKYGVDENAEPEDKEFTELQLKADAHNSRQTKIQEQQKFKIPETPILQKDEAYEQWKQSQESQTKLMEKFRDFYETHAATKTLNESKRVTINLGEGVAPFNFNIDKPQMITKAMTDGGVILNKLMTTQSGEPDVAKQQLVALFSYNPQKFIQDLFNYGQSTGVRKELVEEGQNAQRPQAKVANMQNNVAQAVTVKKFGDIGR